MNRKQMEIRTLKTENEIRMKQKYSTKSFLINSQMNVNQINFFLFFTSIKCFSLKGNEMNCNDIRRICDIMSNYCCFSNKLMESREKKRMTYELSLLIGIHSLPKKKVEKMVQFIRQ